MLRLIKLVLLGSIVSFATMFTVLFPIVSFLVHSTYVHALILHTHLYLCLFIGIFLFRGVGTYVYHTHSRTYTYRYTHNTYTHIHTKALERKLIPPSVSWPSHARTYTHTYMHTYIHVTAFESPILLHTYIHNSYINKRNNLGRFSSSLVHLSYTHL